MSVINSNFDDSPFLISVIDNRFFIGKKNWFISFQKEVQEMFDLIKYHNNSNEIWIISGPGSFTGTRSIVSFVKGFTFDTKIIIKSFNILVDVIPFFFKQNYFNKNIDFNKKNVLYFFQESDRFFYCIYHENLSKRKFFLLDKKNIYLLKEKNDLILIGNSDLADYEIPFCFKICYKTISSFIKEYKNDKFILSELEYCDKFC